MSFFCRNVLGFARSLSLSHYTQSSVATFAFLGFLFPHPVFPVIVCFVRMRRLAWCPLVADGLRRIPSSTRSRGFSCPSLVCSATAFGIRRLGLPIILRHRNFNTGTRLYVSHLKTAATRHRATSRTRAVRTQTLALIRSHTFLRRTSCTNVATAPRKAACRIVYDSASLAVLRFACAFDARCDARARMRTHVHVCTHTHARGRTRHRRVAVHKPRHAHDEAPGKRYSR